MMELNDDRFYFWVEYHYQIRQGQGASLIAIIFYTNLKLNVF